MVRIGLSIAIVCAFLFREFLCDFETDFLGDYISDEEYNNRTLCWTQVCMEDSGRLIYAADHNSHKKEPCEDFKTFAMGNFFEHRVLNERYTFSGFDLDVNQQYAERQKRIMKKPFDHADPKIFKVIKNFFKQCINSSLIESRGTSDIFAYLRRIGNFQFTRDGAADVKKFIESQPDLSIRLFFDYEMTFCKNGSKEFLCMGSNNYWSYSDDWELNATVDALRNLLVDKPTKFKVVGAFIDYLKMKKKVQKKLKLNSSDIEVVKIKELYERFPSMYLDWLQIVNNQLLIESHRTLEDEIMIFNTKRTQGLHKLFVEVDDEILADAFAAAFITTNSRSFTAYVFPKEEARKLGTKRSKQRFEQCLAFLQRHMRPAVEAMMAANFYNKEVQESVAELAALAIKESIQYINNSKSINNETKALMVEKLQSAKLWAMFPDDILNVTKINEIYDELELNATESFVDLFIELPKYDRKLETKPFGDWVKVLRRVISNDFTYYFVFDNIVNVPVKWTLYPYFHPHRSRFFNQVTVYTSVVYGINRALAQAFRDKLRNPAILPNEIMADESYQRWEANGGVDLQLPSFKLTNRQMLWVCMAHRNALKYHANTPKSYDTNLRIHIKYLHVAYKRIPNFRETFQCSDNFTMAEEKQLAEMVAAYVEANRLSIG